MNVLYSPFPEGVEVCGEFYPVATDFRDWIRFCELIETDTIPNAEKAVLMLQWYSGDIPPDMEQAVYALGDFLAARDLYAWQEGKPKPRTNQNNKRAFSFTQDAVDIYSAFLVSYNIDLSEIPYLHWYKFRALFDSLPADCEIKQKMAYRTIDTNTINDQNERRRIRDIQERIQIIEKRPCYVDDYEIGEVFK